MDPSANEQRTIDAVVAFNRGDVERYLASSVPDVVVPGLPPHLPLRWWATVSS